MATEKVEIELVTRDKSSQTLKKTETNVQEFGKICLLKLALTYVTLETVFDKVIGKGIKVNREFENLNLSISALATVNAKFIGSIDESADATERFAQSQEFANIQMSNLKELNEQTTQTLQETSKIYKTLLPSVLQYGGSLDELNKITKLVALSSAASGVEFNSVLASIDGLIDGTFLANSDYGRFLKTVGLTPEVLKNADDKIGLVIDSLKDFESLAPELQKSLDASFSNIGNAYDDMTATLTKSAFTFFKSEAEDIIDLLKEVSYEFKKVEDLSKGGLIRRQSELTAEIERLEKAQINANKAFSDAEGISDALAIAYDKIFSDQDFLDLKEAQLELDKVNDKIEGLADAKRSTTEVDLGESLNISKDVIDGTVESVGVLNELAIDYSNTIDETIKAEEIREKNYNDLIKGQKTINELSIELLELTGQEAKAIEVTRDLEREALETKLDLSLQALEITKEEASTILELFDRVTEARLQLDKTIDTQQLGENIRDVTEYTVVVAPVTNEWVNLTNKVGDTFEDIGVQVEKNFERARISVQDSATILANTIQASAESGAVASVGVDIAELERRRGALVAPDTSKRAGLLEQIEELQEKIDLGEETWADVLRIKDLRDEVKDIDDAVSSYNTSLTNLNQQIKDAGTDLGKAKVDLSSKIKTGTIQNVFNDVLREGLSYNPKTGKFENLKFVESLTSSEFQTYAQNMESMLIASENVTQEQLNYYSDVIDARQDYVNSLNDEANAVKDNQNAIDNIDRGFQSFLDSGLNLVQSGGETIDDLFTRLTEEQGDLTSAFASGDLGALATEQGDFLGVANLLRDQISTTLASTPEAIALQTKLNEIVEGQQDKLEDPSIQLLTRQTTATEQMASDINGIFNGTSPAQQNGIINGGISQDFFVTDESGFTTTAVTEIAGQVV